MSNSLNDELRMLGETVSRYIADRGNAPAPDSGDTWREFAELGWLSLPYAEEVGGLGFGSAGVSAVMQGHGNGLLQSPYLPYVVLAGGVIARCPNGEAHLEQVMSGELRATPAFRTAGTERANGMPKLTATPAADGFRLNGGDVHVLALADANAVLVPAVLDGTTEIGLFLVPLHESGVSSRTHVMADQRAAGFLAFADVTLPATARIDGGIDVRAALDAAWNEALVAVAAENLGAMQALYDQTLEYAKLRQQFGRPIGSFQSLQFRLVDMWIKLDEARSLVAAAASAEAPGEAATLALAAWIQTIWSGRLIGEEAVQIHGAIAMTEEYTVGRYVKRMLVNELLFGAPERHLPRFRSLQAH